MANFNLWINGKYQQIRSRAPLLRCFGSWETILKCGHKKLWCVVFRKPRPCTISTCDNAGALLPIPIRPVVNRMITDQIEGLPKTWPSRGNQAWLEEEATMRMVRAGQSWNASAFLKKEPIRPMKIERAMNGQYLSLRGGGGGGGGGGWQLTYGIKKALKPLQIRYR